MSFIALALAAALQADASPDALRRLEPAFKGTITSTYADGRQGRLKLSRDGGYRYVGRARKVSSGTWALRGENTICLRQRRPIPVGRYCTPIPNGRSWRAKAVGGEMVTLRVVGARG